MRGISMFHQGQRGLRARLTASYRRAAFGAPAGMGGTERGGGGRPPHGAPMGVRF